MQLNNFRLKILFFLLVLTLTGFKPAHKFYVSITQIEYVPAKASLQVISRIFIDDFETVLNERYGVESYLGTEKEIEQADKYVERYLKTKFEVYLNDELLQINYLGKEVEDDILKCYIEITNVQHDENAVLRVENKILFEVFSEQQNIIHYKTEGKRYSAILTKENNKALLNF